MPTVNKERVQLLVDALRSGDYQQTQSVLCTQAYGQRQQYHCCLGVATEVAMDNGLGNRIVTRRVGGVVDYGTLDADDPTNVIVWDRSLLPEIVREWYGFDLNNPTFHEMADNNTICGCDGCRAARETDKVEPPAMIRQTFTATEANDSRCNDFPTIATLFEREYLTPESENGTQEKDQG